MKLRILFTTVLLMAISTICMAQEAYAEYNNGILTFYYDNARSSKSGTTYDLNTGSNEPGWYTDHRNDIAKAVFHSSFKDARPTSTYKWFSFKQSGATESSVYLTEISGIKNLNTSSVTNMSEMFSYSMRLESLDVSGFNTAKVTDMSGMFGMCASLTSLDVSNFNTKNVTNMSAMFAYCSALTSLDVSNFNTANVTNMSTMFAYCRSLMSLNVSGFNTTNVTDMTGMFANCIVLTSLDVSGFNTTLVTDMSSMFLACTSLTSLDVSSFNTANVTAMNGMFYGCTSLTSLDVSSFNTTNVTAMRSMFGVCSSLTSLDLSDFNTTNVTDMSTMFYKCGSLISLDLSGFNTANVTDMSSMFYECSSLISLDLSNFNIAKVTNMTYMFSRCTGLKTIYVGYDWVTDVVTSSYDMFKDCTALVGAKGTTYDENYVDKEYAHIDGGSTKPGYFTKGVETYAVNNNGTLTFYRDNQRIDRTNTTYDLNTGTNEPDWYNDRASITKVVFDSSFKKARPTTTSYWFRGMSHLAEITDIQYLNTSQVTNMSYMFYGCLLLTSLDLSGFNTENVTTMSYMFYGCTKMTSLDLSSFNTGNVISMGNMFNGCKKLETIYAGDGWNTSKVGNVIMFKDCIELVGGEGTPFDSSHTNKEYARIDGGPGSATPGYLTYKEPAGITTGVENGQRNSVKGQRDEWFTIDGQKLSEKPTKKGIYIQNGKKRIIK